VIALLIHAAVDSVFHEPALVLLLVVCGSLALSFRQPKRSQIRIACPRSPAVTAAAVVLFVLLGLVLARPAAAWFAFEKGNASSKDGRKEISYQWYQWASAIQPGNTVYWDVVAQSKVDLFRVSGNPVRLAEAVEHIQLCRDLNTLDARFPARLGSLYLLLADQLTKSEEKERLIAAASKSFEEAIVLDPFSPFNYAELGKLRWRQGKLDEARDFFVRALDYEPNFLPVRALLAMLASSNGLSDQAKAEFGRIRETQGRYQGYPLNNLERQYLEVDVTKLETDLRLRGAN
jgi:tetratricopeptide (TPR) repeat protein